VVVIIAVELLFDDLLQNDDERRSHVFVLFRVCARLIQVNVDRCTDHARLFVNYCSFELFVVLTD